MNDYEDLELQILRKAVDDSQERIKKRIVQSPEIQKIIRILENFLRNKELICYGGIALNNILPEDDQFYNKDVDMPDYDFYSNHAMDDAKELADIYRDNGYTDIEAKAGQHLGTFKVFVNFIGVADITQIPSTLFKTLKRDTIVIDGIHYVPANFLRMGIYKELSSPEGDTSRFEKIYKRLLLLNKYYPITDINCNKVEFQRKMEDESHKAQIYTTALVTFINHGCVFFGGHAIAIYSHYMSENVRKRLNLGNPDFDVFANNPQSVINALKKAFKVIGIRISITKHEGVGEIIPVSYEVSIGNDTIGFIYKTDKCQSYNIIESHGKQVKIATIDTMLHMYFAFLYADKPYYNTDRIICMCNFLFKVQQENKLAQKGVLKRFSITCYGHEEQLEEMRAKKSELYNKLKNDRSSKEYQMNFFNYKPSGNSNKNSKKTRKAKSRTDMMTDSVTEYRNKPLTRRRSTYRRQGPRNYLSSFKYRKGYDKNRRNS